MVMEPLLSVNNLKVHFPIRKGLFSKTAAHVRAVDGVSFHLREGETLGLVGESGCGKTTTGLALVRLIKATSGHILFRGTDISGMSRQQLRLFRRSMQIIFQDPYSSLNPRMTLHQTITEPMKLHRLYGYSEREDRVNYLLEKVGLNPDQGARYPHEFSGGQRQRIGIARALALNPRVIIGDEPVSALDVSIQAQIINLLMDLQKEFHLSYVIISHDLAVMEYVSDRIAVMYLGKIVETAPFKVLYTSAAHPYTRALLSAVPVPDPGAQQEQIVLGGDVPSPINPPAGCRFHPRCPFRKNGCDRIEPELKNFGKEHYVACHLK